MTQQTSKSSPITSWTSQLRDLQDRAHVAELLARLKSWGSERSDWKPWQSLSRWFPQAVSRCEETLARIDMPLIVATFGGTGSGKSTLINALVGSDVSITGRQRPTTMRPLLIAHPDVELSKTSLPIETLEVVTAKSDWLKRVILIDCPDPDTSESSQEGTNTARLRQILPHVDVLLYITTQQKYRSARVLEELMSIAAGCKFLFVQSHADVDVDIRDDWRNVLTPHFDVPDMYFIDSIAALKAEREGASTPAEFERLVKTLSSPFGPEQRDSLRLANLCQLMLEIVELIEKETSEYTPKLGELKSQIQLQQQRLLKEMSSNLQRELGLSKGLWEQRLLSEVLNLWEMTPFSAMLRVYNSLGSLAASFGMARARTTAHLAIIGAIQGARWLSQQNESQAAKERFKQMQTLSIEESSVREVEMIIKGYEQSAGLSQGIETAKEHRDALAQAVTLEHAFLDKASRLIDQMIQSVAYDHTRFRSRAVYETLFLIYVCFVVLRIGYNFFYESLWNHNEIMKLDFYIPAGIFFIIWTGGLIMFYLRGLQRSLALKLTEVSRQLAEINVPTAIFRDVQTKVEQTEARQLQLVQLKRDIQSQYEKNAPSTPTLGNFTRRN